MHTYTFQDRDILNSTILNNSLRPCFITKTTSRLFLGRRSTIVTDLSGTLLATISWKDKTFEINGTAISINSIESKKHHPIFSRNRQRYLQWGTADPQYSMEYVEHQWTATDCSVGSTHVVFNCYRQYFFRKSKPATLILQEALPQTESLFLLLAMLRMETQRLEAERRDHQQQQHNLQQTLNTIHHHHHHPPPNFGM